MIRSQNITLGILAHVDAGKTTLAETLLLKTGAIRRAGRVDHGDTLLDSSAMERARGITIFSSQAQMKIADQSFTLLDTPGHVDFSAEMERTLQVLDYAILVISGADGIQEHVRTLWSLLRSYHVPALIWVNKMDQPGTSREAMLSVLQNGLDRSILPFDRIDRPSDISTPAGGSRKSAASISASTGADQKAGAPEQVFPSALEEELAARDERLIEQYLDGVHISLSDAQQLVRERKIFPCWFGSALKMEGVDALIRGIGKLCVPGEYPDAFGARVFKITRDGKDRLTWMKVTGGTLKVKQTLTASGYGEDAATADGAQALSLGKVEQIRVYDGENAHQIKEAPAGMICAVTGLQGTYSGQGLGIEHGQNTPVLAPVMSYELILDGQTDRSRAVSQLRALEEETPELHLSVDSVTGKIHLQVMGDVQTEVLKQELKDRFDMDVSFAQGSVVYKETIANTVEGVGHYEPLRHYAEVHLKMEPLPEGSGLVFAAQVETDKLDLNWQRLVLTHLQERPIRGVLTGSPVTDMKVTLVAGRAHIKHTEGGDFRQATYRALRQGLMQADNILLEPVYSFRLEVPSQQVGRAMTDLQNMSATFGSPEITSTAVITGTVPAACVGDYQTKMRAYTSGAGHLSLSFHGYEPCHNAAQIIEQTGYDPDADMEYPSGSIFCSHGAGMFVPWDQVPQYMHLPSVLEEERHQAGKPSAEPISSRGEERTGPGGPDSYHQGRGVPADVQDDEELLEIFTRTYGAIRQERTGWKKSRSFGSSVSGSGTAGKTRERRPQALLVDGYNIIFSWDELKELSRDNLDAARERLIQILANYQGYRRMLLIVVFDAYKVAEGAGAIYRYPPEKDGSGSVSLPRAASGDADGVNSGKDRPGRQAGKANHAGGGKDRSAQRADEPLADPCIYVVYTKEAETADTYIERCATQMAGQYDITVATSDAAEQVIIWGAGARRVPAKQFHKEVSETFQEIRRDYLKEHPGGKQYLFDNLDADFAAFLEDVRLGRKKMEDL